jgi:hypothetical protein
MQSSLSPSVRTGSDRLRRVTATAIGVVAPVVGSVGVCAGAERFAAGALSRYAASYAGVAPLDLTLLARTDASITNVFEMLSTLSVRPEFIMRMASTRLAGRGGRAISIGAAAAPVAPRHTCGQAIRKTMERILARERRVDSFHERERLQLLLAGPDAASRAVMPAIYPVQTGARTVEMVLRRSAPSAMHADHTATNHAARGMPSRGVTAHRAPASPPMAGVNVSLAPTELARLTDQVVGAIDRRIVAQRERRGGA